MKSVKSVGYVRLLTLSFINIRICVWYFVEFTTKMVVLIFSNIYPSSAISKKVKKYVILILYM